MAIFLNEAEKRLLTVKKGDHDSLPGRFCAALHKRVNERVEWGTLLGPSATTLWWHSAAEYLSDGAMAYALDPNPPLAAWLRMVTLDIVRKSAYDWVGPAFRDHSEPLTGHLETAHLCWGVSAVYDLARDAFSEEEQAEIQTALHSKGITLCQNWIRKNQHLANWRSVMVSGAIVAAVATGNETLVSELIPELIICHQALQDDGSYGESLQYGNYLVLALTFAREALIRSYPELWAAYERPSFEKCINWFAASMFYAKPLAGWGNEPRARAANFNDSAALFRPSGDVLLHIAVRGNSPVERGLAKWLFEKYYSHFPEQGPHHLATLGMSNDWGFLTLPLLTYDTNSLSPSQAKLPVAMSFSNGNGFIRDQWDGKTILAVNGGSDPLNGLGHLHGDLNSFVVVHNRERLLADPGHSCYRNLIHGLESSSQTHNTCTFLIEKESLGLQEDLAKAALLEQKSVFPRRIIHNGVAGDKINRGDQRLLCSHNDVVSVIGAECAKAYGRPIREFSRFWILAGSHVLFIIDKIEADYPVTTLWNWVVNNRDRNTAWSKEGNCLTISKNDSGMKVFHGGTGSWAHPVYGFLHDAYHPEPNQLGEGSAGDSLLFRFSETGKLSNRTVVHAIALDQPGILDTWQCDSSDAGYTLQNGQRKWTLKLNHDGWMSVISGHNRKWDIKQVDQHYQLIKR